MIITKQDMLCPPIVIRGERHSGTNAMRGLISEACPCSPFKINSTHDYDGVWGWKHAIDLPTPPIDGILVVFIYRNLVSWLKHMARDTYEAKYYDHDGPMDPDDVLPRLIVDSFPGGADGAPDYDSAINMRQQKYIRWHSYAGLHSDLTIEITYERFIAEPKAFLRVLGSYGVKCRSMSLRKYVSRQSSHGRRNRLPNFTSAQLNNLYFQLNRTFEHEIGLA